MDGRETSTGRIVLLWMGAGLAGGLLFATGLGISRAGQSGGLVPVLIALVAPAGVLLIALVATAGWVWRLPERSVSSLTVLWLGGAATATWFLYWSSTAAEALDFADLLTSFGIVPAALLVLLLLATTVRWLGKSWPRPSTDA